MKCEEPMYAHDEYAHDESVNECPDPVAYIVISNVDMEISAMAVCAAHVGDYRDDGDTVAVLTLEQFADSFGSTAKQVMDRTAPSHVRNTESRRVGEVLERETSTMLKVKVGEDIRYWPEPMTEEA